MKPRHILFHRYDEHHYPEHTPHNTNKMAYSSFKHIEDKGIVGGIALKYVSKGLEEYTVGHETYSLSGGHFLLLNRHTEFDVSIDTKDYTNGVCVNLSTDLVKDVLRNFEKKDEALLDLPFNDDLETIPIVDNIYSCKEPSGLGQKLEHLGLQIESEEAENSFLYTTEDVYFDLTLALLQSQRKIFSQVNKLPSIKQSTRKELFKRLSVAKEYIDENLDKGIDIQDISRVATISPFHFHRTFKAVYGLSPHQYRIQKRLGKAAELLMDIDHSITEIAFLTGFADIHSFSRSFKKEFGLPPSRYRRFNGQ